MPEDLNALLNAHLDGRLSADQRAKVLLRLKQPAVARRYERMRSLRADLRAALPEPGSEASRRMWSAIAAQVSAPLAAESKAAKGKLRGVVDTLPDIAYPPELLGRIAPEPWYAVFTRPWAPAWGLGLAGAAAVLAWVFLTPNRPWLHQEAPIPAAAPALAQEPAEAPQAAPAAWRAEAQIAKHRAQMARAREAKNSAVAAAEKTLPDASLARQIAALPAPSGPLTTTGSTEVERALADNQMDDMIDQFLTVRQQSPGPVVAEASPAAQAPDGPVNGGNTVAYQSSDLAVAQDSPASSGAVGPVLGAKDSNGFWNWSPAAQAMNQRQWGQARVELQAASSKAGEAAERVFANSALSLLSAPGAPLEGTQPLLPSVGDLRVLGAGTWQLLVDSRLARFGRGVSVSLPGLRCDGDSFLLDLTFDRGEFAAGTHFTRVSGEAPVRVVDASKQPVTADDFYAPAGADYDIPDRELRLR